MDIESGGVTFNVEVAATDGDPVLYDISNLQFLKAKELVFFDLWIPDSGFRSLNSGFRFPASSFRISDQSSFSFYPSGKLDNKGGRR